MCVRKFAFVNIVLAKQTTPPSISPHHLQMAEQIPNLSTKRYAVVTGANKGIGFEICKQLASRGIMVILTSRDVKRGIEAQEKLKGHFGLSNNVVFHHLDVIDLASIASLVDFIKTNYGRLDILVNNAGIGGIGVEGDPLVIPELVEGDIASVFSQGELLPNEWAKGILSNAETLTEEKIDQVIEEFLKNFEEGSLQTNQWPTQLAAYKISKASLSAYTRIMAKKHPTFCINCVCPGFVRTDMTCNLGPLSVEEGAESPVNLALLADGGPSGLFFYRKDTSFF